MNINQLAQAWLDAKDEEDAAILRRRQIGNLIAAAIPGDDEGTAYFKTDFSKVLVTRKLNRKVDAATLGAAWESLPANVQATFKWSAEINTKHLRALQELNSPELAKASKYFTTKPAAASVTVERIQQEAA